MNIIKDTNYIHIHRILFEGALNMNNVTMNKTFLYCVPTVNYRFIQIRRKIMNSLHKTILNLSVLKHH